MSVAAYTDSSLVLSETTKTGFVASMPISKSLFGYCRFQVNHYVVVCFVFYRSLCLYVYWGRGDWLEFNSSLMKDERKLLVLPLFWVVHVISQCLGFCLPFHVIACVYTSCMF